MKKIKNVIYLANLDAKLGGFIRIRVDSCEREVLINPGDPMLETGLTSLAAMAGPFLDAPSIKSLKSGR